MALFGDLGNRRELEKKAKAEGRLPPGQSLTLKWPVLHYGGVPVFDAAKWDFKISGLVEEPVRLTWEEFQALPQTEVTSDFHCVTRWSRLDNRWKGVLFTDVTELVTHAYEERVQFVDGDAEVVPGVRVHKLGGHTAGMQIVSVMTSLLSVSQLIG